MKHIILTLTVLANSVLICAVWRGLTLGDITKHSSAVQHQVGLHMLIGLGALTFAALVHAVVLTWLIGTGRFVEETTMAYSMSSDFHDRSRQLKYRVLPGMVVCLLLLVSTAALGAVADTATPMSLDGILGLGLNSAQFHLMGAVATVLANLFVNVQEYRVVSANSEVVDSVLTEVRRARSERGLSGKEASHRVPDTSRHLSRATPRR